MNKTLFGVALNINETNQLTIEGLKMKVDEDEEVQGGGG